MDVAQSGPHHGGPTPKMASEIDSATSKTPISTSHMHIIAQNKSFHIFS